MGTHPYINIHTHTYGTRPYMNIRLTFMHTYTYTQPLDSETQEFQCVHMHIYASYSGIRTYTSYTPHIQAYAHIRHIRLIFRHTNIYVIYASYSGIRTYTSYSPHIQAYAHIRLAFMHTCTYTQPLDSETQEPRGLLLLLPP